MKKIVQEYHIKVPIKEVWRALTDPEYIDGWGASPVKMSDKKGFKFSLWGGEIYGTNKIVLENKKLVQDWYGGKWDEPSVASFELTSVGDHTVINFSNENIPDKEFSDIEKGWRDYYFEPLKKYLENKL